MDLFNSLQSILGGKRHAANPADGQQQGGDQAEPSQFQQILSPALLGGLAGALLSGKRGAGGIIKGAALAGGGAFLWNKYKDQIKDYYNKNLSNKKDADAATAAATAAAKATAAAAPAAAAAATATPSASAGSAGASFTSASSTDLPIADQAHNPDAVSADKANRMIRALVFAAKADGHIDDKEKAAISDQLVSLKIDSTSSAMVQQAISEPLDPQLVAQGVTDPEEALQLYTLSCSVINIDQASERNYLDALAKALHIPPEVKSELEMHANK